ncbi:rhodanese-like domain-containing protein [Caldimonas sp. KR1-144]|uniref:rhodanese-like domain-containing protein n=1 Tax=Caldimonas sp. KR1-144 TaxID=3400911 RepID=UPI003C0437AB
MSFFLQNWYLFLAAAVSGLLLLWPAISRSGGGAASVSPSEAVLMINREKAVLIDVSEPSEFASGHALNARNVPLGELDKGGHKSLPSNKQLPVLVMCPTGARARRAVATLSKLGHANVRAVAGGLAAWREAQLPTEKSSTA